MKKVRELLQDRATGPISVSPEQSILSVAQLMRANNIGVVPVVQRDTLLGIISERDMLNKVLAPGIDPRDVYVGQIMTHNITIITPEHTWEDAMEKMKAAHCRHLPVVDNGLLIGMISLRDLLGTDEMELLDRYLWDRDTRQEMHGFKQPELKGV